jgi:hypothetical protein
MALGSNLLTSSSISLPSYVLAYLPSADIGTQIIHPSSNMHPHQWQRMTWIVILAMLPTLPALVYEGGNLELRWPYQEEREYYGDDDGERINE